jgi:regulator of protease activity HflC (stomatin/prohibitin superfamily)
MRLKRLLKQRMNCAEAEAKKTVAKAEGDAKSILLKAEAESQALKLKNSSLTSMLVQYEAIQKWDGKLPIFSTGGAVPFINLNGSQIIDQVKAVSTPLPEAVK